MLSISTSNVDPYHTDPRPDLNPSPNPNRNQFWELQVRTGSRETPPRVSVGVFEKQKTAGGLKTRLQPLNPQPHGTAAVFRFKMQLLTLLEPQSRFGDNYLKFDWIVPQNETAVLKGCTRRLEVPQLLIPNRLVPINSGYYCGFCLESCLHRTKRTVVVNKKRGIHQTVKSNDSKTYIEMIYILNLNHKQKSMIAMYVFLDCLTRDAAMIRRT